MNRINATILLLILSLSTPLSAKSVKEKIAYNVKLLISDDFASRQKASIFLKQAPQVFKDKIRDDYIKASSELSETLPQRIDAYTTITGVLVSKKMFGMSYTVDFEKLDPESNEYAEIKSYMKSHSTNQLCTIKLNALYMLYGNTILRSYFYQDGSILFAIETDWSECSSRK